MAVTSASVNHYWAGLNRPGRKGMRNHYRMLRNIGLTPHNARMMALDALWGLSMAKYWIA
jgi:hypothetical protein